MLASDRCDNYLSYNSSCRLHKEKVALRQVRGRLFQISEISRVDESITIAHSTVLLKTSSSYPLTKGTAENASEEGSSEEGQPPRSCLPPGPRLQQLLSRNNQMHEITHSEKTEA